MDVADETSRSKWRELAGKAGKWTAEAAKVAATTSVEAAKAANKLVREEIERRKAAEAARLEQEARDAERQRKEDQQQEKQRLEQVWERARAGEAGIRRFYENPMNTLDWTTQEVQYSYDKKDRNGKIIGKHIQLHMDCIRISRPLSAMSKAEIEVLKYTDILKSYEALSDDDFNKIKLAIMYNDGHCDKSAPNMTWDPAFAHANGIRNDADAIHFQLKRWNCETKAPAIPLFLSKFSTLERTSPDSPLAKEIKARLIGGNNWQVEADASEAAFAFGEGTPTSLFLGESELGRRMYFTGEGSLISIAPPGSGKTQCNVLPTLLSYYGPAIVLDVKGECFDKTSVWRKTNVGPVYRFSPLDYQSSAKYNPLAFIDNDQDVLWEDCKLLAELLVVPADKNDPSWENRARDVLAGVIAWLVRHKGEAERTMGKIVDVFSKIGWDSFLEDSKYTFEIPPLSRLANALAVMPEKQLEGVLDAGRRHLAVWEGARVERVTSSSDWSPAIFREGSNPTIYICVSPNEIEAYAPLLRVIFAQHIRALMKKLPSKVDKPILFMLDELPRLGPMKPVEEALEVGRQYGIKLWMFAQSLGQLEGSYSNAQGMVGSCALRIYMNPSSHDGTAQRVSEELGYKESILDGTRMLLVEPTTLTGPDYKDWQIIFGRNSKPAKVRKVFAFNSEPFVSRMSKRA